MKLLLMGAGYVGMAFLGNFHNSPHEICITTTKEERTDFLKQYGSVFLLSSNSDACFNELLDSCEGAIILVAPGRTQNYEEAYLTTASRIGSALKGRKTPFYLLYTSSTSVYEGMMHEWMEEDMALNPQTANGKILLETERCFLACSADVCILRMGGIYGPGRELADRASRFSGKEMPGSGSGPTNHIHLEDCVAALAFCLEHSLKGIYNLVNEVHPTRKELYSNLCRLQNLPCPLWNGESSNSIPEGYKVSNRKIKDAGFLFTHPSIPGFPFS